MEAKRPTPTPPECPVCTSREVVIRGICIRIMDKFVTGAERKSMPKRKPKPKVIRYRCKQCGHKLN